MRSARIALILWGTALGVALTPLSSVADPCAFRPLPRTPRAYLDGKVAKFRAEYDAEWATCADEKRDALTVEWRVGSGSAGAPVRSDKVKLSHPKRGAAYLSSSAFPSNVCDGVDQAVVKSAKRALVGRPGEEQVSALLPLRAHVLASGTLAPATAVSEPLDYPCALCTMSRGGRLDVDLNDAGDIKVSGELSADWYECARHSASLQLLAFAGTDRKEVERAIRPRFAIEGMERMFQRRGDKFVLSHTVSRKKLCATASVWAFEFWGKGELMRSGSRRMVHTLKCDP